MTFQPEQPLGFRRAVSPLPFDVEQIRIYLSFTPQSRFPQICQSCLLVFGESFPITQRGHRALYLVRFKLLMQTKKRLTCAGRDVRAGIW